MLSGAVPQISLICGPCAGGAAYSPALTDFIIQTRKAQMFITGPQVIKGVTGEIVTAEQLGGPEAHMANSGVIHFIAEDDRHAVLLCQKLLSFLPSNNLEDPPRVEGDPNVDPNPALDEVVPAETKKGYDVREVIAKVVDFGDFLEVQQGYAMNIVVGFARIAGRTIGIIANPVSYTHLDVYKRQDDDSGCGPGLLLRSGPHSGPRPHTGSQGHRNDRDRRKAQGRLSAGLSLIHI